MNIEEAKKALEVVAEATKDDLNKRLQEAETAHKQQIEELETKNKTLEQAVTEQGTLLKQLEINSQAAKPARKSFGGEIEKALKEMEKELLAMKDNRGAANLSLKAPSTMLTTDIVPAVTGMPPYILTDFEDGINPLPRLPNLLRSIMDTRRTTKMYIAWAEQTNIQGAAGMVAEGALKPMNSFDLMEKLSKVEKIAKFIKTSKENLDDIPEMMALIRDELRYAVELKLDQQLYSGTGTSPELKGISLIAPTMDVTGSAFAGAVANPNYFDVIMAAVALIAGEGFQATAAIVNPQDAAMIEMTKDLNGNYILPPFATSGGTQIAGIRIIPTPVVPLGHFVVGDWTKAHLRIREEFVIDIGYENDDFTRNLITIIGEMRAGFYVKTNDIPAFVQGDFDVILAAITPPVTP